MLVPFVAMGAVEKVKMKSFLDFVDLVLPFFIPVRPESSGRALWLRDLDSTKDFFEFLITPFLAFPQGGRNKTFPPWGKMKGGKKFQRR
jgi:hypothetical protein